MREVSKVQKAMNLMSGLKVERNQCKPKQQLYKLENEEILLIFRQILE